MMPSLKNKFFQRCRPLFGTFVEISITCHPDSEIIFENTFKMLEDLEKRLSIFNENSDISKLNKTAHLDGVNVHSDTYKVLKKSIAFFEQSDGIFDCAYQSKNGTSQDILLLPENTVRFLKPLMLDLGGIGKGFAVDKAVQFLTRKGISGGVVNAGGDLRFFGDIDMEIVFRSAQLVSLQHAFKKSKQRQAFASSRPVSETINASAIGHWNGQTKTKQKLSFGVCVNASSCCVADALTKIVLIMGESSEKILRRYKASVVAFSDMSGS